jgi:hypothetical protein
MQNIADQDVYTGKASDSKYVPESFYTILFRIESLNHKEKNWISFIKELDTESAYQYDDHIWLREVFENYDQKRYDQRVVSDAILVSGYQDTSWFKFIESVHWFKREALTRLAAEGLSIPL